MRIKNVLGYEGLYAISEKGEVFNLKRGTIVKQSLRGEYMSVSLSKNNKRQHHPIHSLVYQAFKGVRSNVLVIDHFDGNKFNNHYSNLRQITNRENVSRSKVSKYGTGITFLKPIQKFKSEISINKERYYLGVFTTQQEAENAYQTALSNWEKDSVKPFKRDRTKKHCVACDTTKSVNEFYHVKSHGYSHLCKECHKVRMNEIRQSK